MFDIFHAFRARRMTIVALTAVVSLSAEDAPKKPVVKGKEPKIVYVDPNHSLPDGNVPVTITGENFRIDSKVFFGDAEATDITEENRPQASFPEHHSPSDADPPRSIEDQPIAQPAEQVIWTDTWTDADAERAHREHVAWYGDGELTQRVNPPTDQSWRVSL